MATDAQIAANRLNALKSTGPRTQAGKDASRWNALQYGAFARSALIPAEDERELAALAAEYYEQKLPATAEERFHVDTMIRCEWQIRRLTTAETTIWIEADPHAGVVDENNLGVAYRAADRHLTRITRQIAALHRLYRESSSILAKCAAHREPAPVQAGPETGVAETNPISPAAPRISTTYDPHTAPPVLDQIAACPTDPAWKSPAQAPFFAAQRLRVETPSAKLDSPGQTA